MQHEWMMANRDVTDSGLPGITSQYLRYPWVRAPIGNKDADSDTPQTAAVDRPLSEATQGASLCTYISALLMQVSGHFGLHQHCHRLRIRPLVEILVVPTGTCVTEKVLPAHL